MPFYEYQCSACQHHVEVLQKISDAPLRKCPNCGKQALKRLISAPVFRLKGGGWYETDFKSDNERKRNIHGSEEGESKPAESKTEGSKTPDAKPEATKDTPKPAPSVTAKKPAAAARKSAPRKAAAKPASRKKSSRR